MNKKDLVEYFKYHACNENQIERMNSVRDQALKLANMIDDSVPDCADKSSAIRHLRVTIMEFNAAVACQGHVGGYSLPTSSRGPSFSETKV